MSGKRIVRKPFLVALLITILGSALWYGAQTARTSSFNSHFSILNLSITPKSALNVLFTGDIMLDRNVKLKIDEIGFDEFFKGVKDLVANADVAVGNLEGPFTNFPSVTTDLNNKALIFTFDPKLAPKLATLGFDILGLANNHTYNFGAAGFAQTKKNLADANIIYYGDPNNKNGLSVVLERKGITLGIVGFHEFTYENFDKVTAEIDRIRPLVDFLVVTPHWGVEYQKTATDFQTKWAHTFIDHGADLVIGSHPHVVGDVEEYKGKKIFYSLGNFAFDQYFSKATSEGLAVNVALEKQNDKIIDNYTLTSIVIDKQGVSVSE